MKGSELIMNEWNDVSRELPNKSGYYSCLLAEVKGVRENPNAECYFDAQQNRFKLCIGESLVETTRVTHWKELSQ